MSGEPFVLRPADIKEPYRRWQLVASLAEEGDRVQVEFFDNTNHLFRVVGTYLGKSHHMDSVNTVNNGDTKTIVVVAETFHRRYQANSQSEVTWPGGTCGSVPFVIDTANIVSIEGVDGPSLFTPREVDREALRTAIRQVLGSATEGLLDDIVDNYDDERN